MVACHGYAAFGIIRTSFLQNGSLAWPHQPFIVHFRTAGMTSPARSGIGHPTFQGMRLMTRIGIFGAAGRMGRAIAQVAQEAGLEIAGGTDRGGAGELAPGIAITADPLALAEQSDVLIDFSVPAALSAHLDACIAAKKPILIGTTGLESAHHALIDEASKQVPILQTGNTSLGVNLLAALVEQAAARLNDDWDIEIVEMHHRHKVDAPSGTALLLGEAAARGRGIALADHSERGRDGITGARARGAIGFAALRGGSVAGDHQVILAAEGERIEIGHRAENRVIFARGAVKGAEWLIGQPVGRYDMKGVLGL
jgi:4-hydroxy-tetrahydrodipicolinate reductase